MSTSVDPVAYDLVVIGGGSGGIALAKEAAKFDKTLKIAIFDYVEPSTCTQTTWGLGGTCVNVGCIPKYLSKKAASFAKSFQYASSLGWDFGSHLPQFDWTNMMNSINDYVKSLNHNYKKQLKSLGIKYINARAKLVDKNTIEYRETLTDKSDKSDDRTKTLVKAKVIVLAVGGRPNVPDLPGSKTLGITSDDLFWLQKDPGKTLVIGGGYIALECASFLNLTGHEVDVMVRSELLGDFDRQCADQVGQLLELNGVKFLKGYIPQRLDPAECFKDDIKTTTHKIIVTYRHKANAHVTLTDGYDTVLFAIGRTSSLADLGLEKVGVEYDVKSMKIKTSTDLGSTNVDTIFAIGDCVVNNPELSPLAIKNGVFLARKLFSKVEHIEKLRDVEYGFASVPTCVFTSPEYACVGFSQQTAENKYGKDNIYCMVSRFAPLETATHYIKTLPQQRSFEYCNNLDYKESDKMLYTLDTDDDSTKKQFYTQHCLTKLIYRKVGKTRSRSDVVVGVHFVGPNAGEVIQSFTLAILERTTKLLMESMIGIHPTNAEEFTTLKVDLDSGENYMKQGDC